MIWFALEILKSSIIWIIFLISLLTTTLLWYSFELFWQCEKDLIVILIYLFHWSWQMLQLLSIIESTWAIACWHPGCSLAALNKYHSQMDLLHFLGADLHFGAIKLHLVWWSTSDTTAWNENNHCLSLFAIICNNCTYWQLFVKISVYLWIIRSFGWTKIIPKLLIWFIFHVYDWLSLITIIICWIIDNHLNLFEVFEVLNRQCFPKFKSWSTKSSV